MKKFSFNPKTLDKLIVLLAFVFIAITIDSCKKENEVGTATPTTSVNKTASAKSAKLNSSVSKALRDIVISGAITTNQQTGAGSGSSTYSNVSINVTISSTPSANIYAWSNPSTGTSFVLTASVDTSGGGFGQLSFNGKSFNYNYVLSIKASVTDTAWSGFFNGRDLRGVVAIDGNVTGKDFGFANMAIFLVDAESGDGNYDFVSWNNTYIKSGNAIGEVLDFSDVLTNNILSIPKAKILFTSNGSIDVNQTNFTLSSNAMVTDILTNTQYPISGSISSQ